MIAATAGVHWLTASTRVDVGGVQHVLGELGPPERPGAFGHPYKRVHESGTAVYCGSDAPDQPLVINAPGEVCETWAPQLAEWFAQLGAMCTRIDVAMDVQPPELARRRISCMYRAFRRGEVQTRIHRDSCSITKSEGEGEGWTLYLGRPASELMLRCYDRRGPLRIETQWRPQGVARELVADLLVRKGAAHMWRRCASRVVFPKLEWYGDLLAGDVEDVPVDQRGASSLDEAMYQAWKQHGSSFWMFGLLGKDLTDLQRAPEVLTPPQARKFRSWTDAHERAGHDVSTARRELEKRCPR